MSREKREDNIDIFNPIMETSGNCVVFWDDGFCNDASFSIYLNKNGKTTGLLKFQNVKDPHALRKHVSNNTVLKLEGTSSEREKIIADKCEITKRQEKWADSLEINTEISIGKLEFPDGQISESSEGLSIKFYVTNMFKTLRVILDTDMGKLRIYHFEGMDRLEFLMKEYNIPLITSSIILNVPKDKVTTLDDTIKRTKEFVQDFLKLTMLAQTSWQSVVAVTAYDHTSDGKNSRIFFEILRAKTKQPSSLGLASEGGYQYFLKSALSGYDAEVDKKYGFSYALEWYIDSWISANMETKFLCATTSLELLLEQFHAKNGTDVLLDDEKFKEFKEKAEEKLSKILRSMGVEKETRGLMYLGLNAMKRRSYLNKLTLFLEYWKIKYDDVGVTLEDIVKIRNKIIHEGKVSTSDPLWYSYKGLFTILTRIFLAMIKFDFEYWDITKTKYVNFKDVTTS